MSTQHGIVCRICLEEKDLGQTSPEECYQLIDSIPFLISLSELKVWDLHSLMNLEGYHPTEFLLKHQVTNQPGHCSVVADNIKKETGKNHHFQIYDQFKRFRHPDGTITCRFCSQIMNPDQYCCNCLSKK